MACACTQLRAFPKPEVDNNVPDKRKRLVGIFKPESEFLNSRTPDFDWVHHVEGCVTADLYLVSGSCWKIYQTRRTHARNLSANKVGFYNRDPFVAEIKLH